jgi:demethylmenaquinone methyltransferase/2-methoxy-6-polyprenyl-1,4-benzoquinol methylase
MFADIAPKYDITNTVLSLGIHHYWRAWLVKASGAQVGMRVLDCATGTGDLAIAFKRSVGRQGTVLGTDFCAAMMSSAPAKAAAQGVEVHFEVADVMNLPYTDGMFDIASIAFGIRNVDKPVQALSEMARVVRPGGCVMVLEFGQPQGWFGKLYRWYSDVVIPRIGGFLTGRREAYSYLNRTAAAFPCGASFEALMYQTGRFTRCFSKPLTFGVAWVYGGIVRELDEVG